MTNQTVIQALRATVSVLDEHANELVDLVRESEIYINDELTPEQAIDAIEDIRERLNYRMRAVVARFREVRTSKNEQMLDLAK